MSKCMERGKINSECCFVRLKNDKLIYRCRECKKKNKKTKQKQNKKQKGKTNRSINQKVSKYISILQWQLERIYFVTKKRYLSL